MKRTARRVRKDSELAITNGMNNKTVGDVKNTSKSKEQMKKDWGSPRSTMDRKLSK